MRSGRRRRRRCPTRRPPGAVVPRHAGEQVYVAGGELRGVAWRLSASACDYAAVRAVGVFLSVPGGGGGARCDIASSGEAPGGVSPRILAERLVQTYFDPVAGRTWAFGALPASARSVSVDATGARATVPAAPADPRAVGRGDLPAGMRVFVAALDGARDVPRVVARDGSGAVLLICLDRPLHHDQRRKAPGDPQRFAVSTSRGAWWRLLAAGAAGAVAHAAGGGVAAPVRSHVGSAPVVAAPRAVAAASARARVAAPLCGPRRGAARTRRPQAAERCAEEHLRHPAPRAPRRGRAAGASPRGAEGGRPRAGRRAGSAPASRRRRREGVGRAGARRRGGRRAVRVRARVS